MFTQVRRVVAVCALIVVVVAAGCESTPPAPIHRESLQEVTATVTDVRKAERQVTVQGPDGRYVTVAMGPEVRNFDQIRTGDSVVVSYYESISFAAVDAGAATQPGTLAVAAGRAPQGARPGAVGAAVAETTVTFQAFDASANVVTFTDEANQAHAAVVQRADGREFAKKLNRGDRVVITAAQAVAVRVTPAN